MNVLISGRTKMGGNGRCIGGLLEDGTPVRLLRSAGHHWDTAAPFQIGQIWDVSFSPAGTRPPPHTEDVVVKKYSLAGTETNLRARLLELSPPWKGGINKLFGGLLGFTSNNNGYISERGGVPNHSTGFWIPDRDLKLREDSRHYDYPLWGLLRRGLSYVGEPQAIPSIAAGNFGG